MPELDDKVAACLERWRGKLIELTRRNPLLHLGDRRGSALTIVRPGVQEIWDRLLLPRDNSWHFWLPPEGESSDESPPYTLRDGAEGPGGVRPGTATLPPREQLTWRGVREGPRPRELECAGLDRVRLLRALTALYRRSRDDLRERGLHVLHLAFGMLDWPGPAGDDRLRSPLLLLPVQLSRATAHDPFTLARAADEEPIVNPALQTLLRRIDLQLPDLEDAEDATPAAFIDGVKELLAGRPDWKVQPAVVLAAFSFTKAVIYDDLFDHEAALAEHWLVRALAREKVETPASETPLPEEHDLDAIQDPEQTFHILDADASQRLCLEAARRGHSFVLHGPPGTGKSQTIANLIAERLALGQTVLFVSEKMAALDVVYKQLRQAGLGDFCLELHSHKANKLAVVRELERCLSLPPSAHDEPGPSDFQTIRNQCERLNAYAAALHRIRGPLGQSLWTVLGELAERDDVPLVPIGLSAPEKVTVEWLEEAARVVQGLARFWPVFVRGSEHPWWGFRTEHLGLEVRHRVTAHLDRLLALLPRVRELAHGYASRSGAAGSVERILQAADLLDSSPRPPTAWLTGADMEKLQSDLDRLAQLFAACAQRQQALLAAYGPTIFTLPEGTATAVQAAWQQSANFLRGGSGFVPLRKRLRDWAEQTHRLASAWRQDAATLGNWLRLTVPDPSPRVLPLLLRLFELSQEGPLPEASWLTRPSLLETVRTTTATLRPALKEYCAGRDELLRRYDERFFSLDLDHLAERFAGAYRSWTRFFRPGYHADRRSIGRVTRDGVVPQSVRQDILAAREVVRRRAQLEGDRVRLDPILGRYSRGVETDPEAISRGVRQAQGMLEVLAHLGSSAVPAELAGVLAAGKPAPPKVKAAAERLGQSLPSWQALTAEVRALLPLLLPGQPWSLEDSPLSAVGATAGQLLAALDRLNGLLDPVLQGAPAAPADMPQLLEDLAQAEGLRRWLAAREADRAQWVAQFGPGYRGVATDWTALRKALAWARSARAFFAPAALPAEFIQAAAAPPSSAELRAVGQELRQGLAVLAGWFEPPAPAWEGRPLLELPVAEVEQPLRDLRDSPEDLVAWIDAQTLRVRLDPLGLAAFWEAVQRALPDPEQLVDVFLRSVYSAWADAIIQGDPALRVFNRAEHDAVIAEFRQLDERLLRAARPRIARRAELRRPGDARHVSPDSDIGILRHEAGKKRAHRALRWLFAKIPNLLFRLKPCFLMSPLSVSQFLGPDVRFDLVVFDEASQICTEDALGAIYRSKNQVLVVGDNQQLPPTAFFTRDASPGEDDRDEAGDSEPSILDACLGAGLPKRLLRWHYRSRHERLIAFSNEQFYDRQLITFPAAHAAGTTRGVHFHHVPDGVYGRGHRRDNPREAAVVADLVLAHYRESPERTLGVIAFSQAQMTAIEDEIDRRLAHDRVLEALLADDRLEGFFVKNLETVQGDERDVILLSVGYGRDRAGKLSLNFGPLNQAGGHRRLNVAVTRAREKLVVVSSLRAADFDPTGRSEGLSLLHSYLEYAERGGGEEAVGCPGEATPLAAEVAAELQRHGLEVVPQLGCSSYRLDLAVRDPGADHFLLGVECDGPNYHRAGTARDRDRLRREVLGRLGWRLHRIWSIDWVYRHSEEVGRLLAAVEEARREGPVLTARAAEEERPAEVAAKPTPTVSSNGDTAHLPGVVPYDLCKLVVGRRFREVPFADPAARDEQCRLLAELVAAEGPVHREIVAQRLREAWGVEAMRKPIRVAVDEALERCIDAGKVSRRGEFLWPAEPVTVPVRQRSSELHEMYRKYIAPEELQEALLILVRQNLALPEDALFLAAARLIGYRWAGEVVRQRLREQLDELLHRGAVVVQHGRVTLPPDNPGGGP
jgi:hypothetical protein